MTSELPKRSRNSTPVSQKLEIRINALREVIDRKKSDVLRVGGEMKQLIEEKSQQIISDLEGIWDKANAEVDKKRREVNKEIEEINKGKKEIDDFFNNMSQSRNHFEKMNEAINSVENEMDIDFPYIKLKWGVDELRESIGKMCTCEQLNIRYKENSTNRVMWGSGRKGDGESQLLSPWGITVDYRNDLIFVADNETNRIQVFQGNGNWVISLEDEQMKRPENINLIHNSLFVQCRWSIVKFNSTGLESCRSFGSYLSGICTDNTNVYVGAHGMKLIALTHELNGERDVTLTTQYKQEATRIKDISLAREEFYVLLSDSEYPIQSFSKHGTLNRCIVHIEISNNVWFFCLDQQLNILVADNGNNQVKVFSNDGKLVTKFGKKGTAKGEFNYLTGIAVDEFCNIITTDWKDNHRLQTFSPE